MMDDIKKSQELDLTPIDHELDVELLHKQEEEGEESEPTFSLQSRRDERQLALYLLYALDRAEYSIDLEDVIKEFERGFDIKVPKKCFASTVVKGVVCQRSEFDENLKPYLKNWSLERLGCCTRLILYIALFELQSDDSIGSIVINEAVELAKTFAEKDAYRFVNGILDEIVKARVGDSVGNETKGSEQNGQDGAGE